MRIFLIRHGESIQNTNENTNNLPDHLVTLTKNGEKQAKECGQFLKEYCKNNKIDLSKSTLFVSPYERTRQTANIINQELNIKDVKEDVILIERQYGLYDGITFEERKKYKEPFDFNNWLYQNNGYFYSKFPLGESPFDVMIRARLFLQTLFRDVDKGVENFFIISHGMFLKTLQMTYFHYSPEWFNNPEIMDNCAVKLIEKLGNESFDRNFIFKGPATK